MSEYDAKREFVRAPAPYREIILAVVRKDLGLGGRRVVLNILKNPYSNSYKPNKLSVIDLNGITFRAETRSEYGELDFLKFRPDNSSWGAYWVRGKGMKVYGDYALFEQDIVLLKTFA